MGTDATDAKVVHTFCRYCLAGCGIRVTVRDNRVEQISADKQNPHTWQDFCAKGRTANEMVEHPRRLLNPMRRSGDTYVEATWSEAIADISHRMRAIVTEDGPDAVAAYWGNPAGYSSSNLAFMTAWLDAVGTGSRYSVGSVDQNAMHVVAEALYGSAFFAPVSDIDNCDFFLLVGANPAVSAWNWFETVPGGWRRALQRQKRGACIVVVDPVRTETAEKADIHLAPRPGQDWALLLGLVKVIFDEGLEHAQDCAELATGIPALRILAAEADLDDLAARCDLPRERIESVARAFATAERAMAVTRTGISLHLAGTIGEWLGHVLNLITGRMDRPGGRRFEPGYVDVQRLIAVMGKPSTHRSRVSGRSTVAGYHAIDELPDEIVTPGHGRVRALVLNGGNPVVSGPDGAKLDKALQHLDLLVALDLVQRESHRHAHWLLPAAHWLERSDLHALASQYHDEPYAHLGAQALKPPAGVREEWRFFVDLSLAMGRPLFGYRGLNLFVTASRRLAKLTRRPKLEFDPQWIDRLMVMSGRTIKWKDLVNHPHGLVFGTPEFGHFRKALCTEDKKVHAAPVEFIDRTRELLADPLPTPPEGFPFQLGNRRNRHSMNSWLNELPGLHRSGKRNDAIINPADAAALGVGNGDRVRIFSPCGEVVVTATVSDSPRRGVVIVDHGWGSRIFDPRGGAEPHSYGANRNLLVSGAHIDPLSQTTALNSTYVGIERVVT